MGRKLATIQKIIELNAIPNADKIEVASILGWKCVVLKGQFKVGDRVIYCEIDSFLPVRPEFEFLRKSCYKKLQNNEEGFRIKTIRLKGQISQGLVLPIDLLKPQAHVHIDFSSDRCLACKQFNELKEGDDVTQALGVMLYQPPIPACISGEIKGTFPGFIPKTDETRVQVLQPILTRYKGCLCYVTEKLDGSSATYYLYNGEFGVCSRNLELKESKENAFWAFAREVQIEEKLRKLGKNIALQGELVGNGIQKNYLNIEGRKVFFFNIVNLDKYQYYNHYDFVVLLQELDLPMVPLLDDNFVLIDDIPALVEYAKGKSVLNPKVLREGVVIRPLIEQIDMQMSSEFSNGRVSFKSINPEYLLEED